MKECQEGYNKFIGWAVSGNASGAESMRQGMKLIPSAVIIDASLRLIVRYEFFEELSQLLSMLQFTI